MWILFLCTPRLELNGHVALRPWGTHRFDVPAGRHGLRVWFAYGFFSQAGLAAIPVDVYPGQTTIVRYSAPFLVFMSGSLYQARVQPMAGPAMLPGARY
jgi:hypothetical protein